MKDQFSESLLKYTNNPYMAVDNSTQARLARLKEKNLGTTAIGNLQEQVQTTPVAPMPVSPPVVPPSPPVVPLSPTPTNPPQTIQWVNGESFPLKNNPDGSKVVPETPIPTPTTPVVPPVVSPVVQPEVPPVQTTPKVETIKPPEAPIDYNQWLGREADIMKNLDTFKSQWMNSDQIKQASSYMTATPEKKAIIDSYTSSMVANANIPMDQKDIVSALISGKTVPVQKTQAYNNAVVQANEFKRLNGMTSTQLLDNLKQWQIGTEMNSLLSQNPNFAKAKAELEKIQKVNSINRATEFAVNTIKGKETPVVDELKGIEAKYSAPIGVNAQAYEQYVSQNSDVVTAWKQVKQLATQISELTTTYNQALKDLKAQYPDMPASALLTLMRSRTGETKSLLDSYIDTQTTAKGDFDLAMKMAEGHYGAVSKDIAEANQIAQEKRQNANALTQNQALFDQKIAQNAQMMNDPAMAIQSVMDEYKKLWIPFTESIQSKLANFQSSGLSLPEYLNQMTKDIQAKPEYKALKDKAPWKTPVWQEWEDSTGKHAGWVTPGVNPTTIGVQPTGWNYNPTGDQITTLQLANGKNITMASRPANALSSVINANPSIQIDYNNLYRTPEQQKALYGKGRTANELVMAGIDAKYAKPNEKQVTWTLQSNHMSGTAVDLTGSSLTPQNIAIMNRAGFYQPPDLTGKDPGHFEYKGNGNTSIQWYSADDYMNAVINGAGWASKLSDYDSKRIQAQVAGWMKDGLSPQEALLKYKGFIVKDKTNVDKAMQAYSVFSNMKVQPTGYEAKVSNFINSGNTDWLNNYINTALDREVSDVNKTDATGTPEMKVLNDNTTELVNLIARNKDKVGAFDGRYNEFLNKLSSTPDFQKIKTLLQGVQAVQRKFYAGSAVTPTEMQALKDFIGGTQNMNADNLITQLQSVNEQAQKKYNAQRAMYLGWLDVGNPTQAIENKTDWSTLAWTYVAKSWKSYNLNDYK